MQTFLHYRWRVPSTLHRLHPRRIIPLLLLAQCVTGAKAQTYQSYDANTCYTKVLIDSKINDFAGNTKPMGFGSYDDETGKITQPVWYNEIAKENTRNLVIDYVAGLVAKACIEAADYYKDFTWSKPWFKLVENYATKVTVPTTGASLDDLNAAKMYFALAELTKPGAKYANSTTYDKAINQLKNAITGLTAVNEKYSIRSGSTVNYYSSGKNKTYSLVDKSGKSVSPTASGNMNAIGGWYHKATYPNQMWCDSEYMGPALLAQLVAYATNNSSAGIGTVTSSTEDDWKLIAKQFDITWNYLWNSKDKLLYHGFSATPTALAAHTYTWATETNGTNAAYWGRAIGWYFLALVDVLENMPENITDNSYTSTQDNLKTRDADIKKRLTSYLTELAAGIWAQKKSTSNLWTNVINKTVDAEYSTYATTDAKIQLNKKNYLEASASAIYIAAYIKAMRLGLLSTETYKSGIDAAYQSYINNFITTDNNIINTCASAGLGGGDVNITSAQTENKENGAKYRNGTAAYYTRGYDVTKVTTYQEGKPLGAFILASTEYERYMKADYAPSFTATNAEKPTAQTVTKGQSVTLHAAAMAKPLATYKWYSYPASSTRATTPEGTLIEGATSSDLTVKPEVNTYYYCVATNTVNNATATATTDHVLVTVSEASNEAVLNPSNLAYTNNNNNAWTPAANGTIEVSKLVSSSSKGAYSITTGNGDVATISGTTIIALESGTFTLSQAADDNYQAGSIQITVRIGQDVTSDGSNAYSFTAQTTDVSDGMTITRKDITMTFGNDGFWSKPSENGYTQGQNTPVVSNNIPQRGTFYKFNATTTGSLQVKVKLGHDGKGKLRPLYVSENGILVKAKDKDGKELDPAKMPEATANYEGIIIFPVKANTDYYVYVPGSKLGFFGFTFEPATLYTVTFNAGTNGTCNTPSLMQESANATITLPSVTPKTGYTFDGWYTEGGTEIGVAGGFYQPTNNITLYAHYTETSSGSGATSYSGVVSFTGDGTTTTNEDVVSASGNMKSNPGTITYKGENYSNALKIQQSTSVTLTLTAKSNVVLVFNPNNKGNKIKVDGNEYSIEDNGTITVSELGSGTHTITRGSGESHFYAVDIQSTGASLTITTQPVSADYLQNATADALSVAASIVNGTTSGYNFSYQWYSNDNESTTGSTRIGDPTTEPSCTPDVTVIGTKYYYCVVTATKGTEVLTATSDFAKVTVNGPTVTFTTQPQGAVYKVSASNVAALTVAATTNFKGDVAYQWYSNTTGKIPETDAEKVNQIISGATSADYTPSISKVGTTYYYCIASSTYNESKCTAISDLVCVEVVTALYSYNVKDKTQPKCNESRSIEDGSGNTLVKFTFGGWKYNNNRYLKPNADNIDANYITDEWSAPATQEVNALDGYQYAISGKNDAVQENKAEETTMYKKTRYGWFQSPTRNTDGVTTDSHPYTLPVRGAYMTFEPTQNGTLTIYLLQNGAWNSDTKNKIDIIPGEFRMHAFQITNQRGLVLAEFAPQYKITVNQKVKDGYTCSQYENDPGTGNYDKTSKDISNWEEFWALTYEERKAVHDNWSNGTNGSQTIIKLKDGSFLAIQKAIVKYQFHVTGNETYYLFSNFSKLGFSGATFQPDADSGQPTDVTTFSGAKSLDETKPYTKITPTADGTIGDTGLTKFKYTIDGQEIKLVDGVFIPQFKAITLNRTFKKDQWTTLTLPFNLTQTEVEQIFGKGTEILVFKDAITEGTKLHIKFIYHEIQNILPGYPYLIKPTLVGYDNGTTTPTDYAPKITIEGESLKSFTVYGKAINPHIKQYEFKSNDNQYVAKGTPDYCTASENGVYSKKYEEGDLFISEGDGKLYISQGASYGKGYRSYIDYTGTDTSASTKTLSLSFSGVEDGEDDGTTTEISVAELADDVIEAFGIKGVYNLNGQKVAETTRNLPAGIYVVNGRKVVVK